MGVSVSDASKVFHHPNYTNAAVIRRAVVSKRGGVARMSSVRKSILAVHYTLPVFTFAGLDGRFGKKWGLQGSGRDLA
jgi:hypothetical protein